jgi:di/tricarboxylate transporter
VSLIQVFSIVILVIAFGVAIWRHLNVGLTTIPAGLVLCLIAGVPVTKYFARFPGELVVLILGVSLLFGHIQRCGAIDWLTDLAVRATGRRDWILPWIMFLLAAVLSGIGALPAAALAVVVPLAMRAAIQRRISLMLMGLVTICGALAGGFSPISVWGRLVVSLAARADRPISAPVLFGSQFVLNLVVGVIAFVIFGGLRLVRRPVVLDDDRPGDGVGGTTATRRFGVVATRERTRASAYEVTSLVGLVGFVVAVLAFQIDVGLAAFAVALLLQVIFRPPEAEVLRSLPWAVVLVIAGVLLYVGLLEQVGTFRAISAHLGAISNVGLAVLTLAFVGSLFASFESSAVAVLGLVIPVAVQATPGVGGTALLVILCAVAWAIVVVNPSPYHLSGGLVLAHSPESAQPRMFRQLLFWSLAAAVVVPVLGWLFASVLL